MNELEIKDLTIHYITRSGTVRAVNDVSFSIGKGETLGLVGETGAGKTTTALGILRLVPDPPGKIIGGEILFEGKDIMKMTDEELREMRGGSISMIFQDPMTALNPVYTVGRQIREMIRQHKRGMRRKELRHESVQALAAMGIPAAEIRDGEYPHQFSGGMRQRAMIAMAMSCDPKILLADEPTTALDVTISAQIFELMNALKREHGTAIVMITHNMGVVAEMADDVAVMYMGNIVEYGSVEDVFVHPMHPYTRALLRSIPVLGKGKDQQLEPIRGMTPDPFHRPKGCQFCPRCDFATERCEKEMPQEEWLSSGHYARCFHIGEGSVNGK